MYVFQLIKINNMRLTLIFNFALLILNLKGQSYKGLIMDYKTSKPIAYANIGIPSKGYGVVCNEQGEFNLKITNEKGQTVYLGKYQNLTENQSIDIDISDTPSGIYFVFLQSDKDCIVSKLVKI